jgi:hypothetical protein
MAIDRVMKKDSDSYGLPVDQVKNRLKETKYRDTEGNLWAAPTDEGYNINAPTMVVPAGDGTGTVSAGGSQSEGAGAKLAPKQHKAENARFKKHGITLEQIADVRKSPADAPDPIYEARVVEAAAKNLAEDKAKRSAPNVKPGLNNIWKTRSAPSSPSFGSLTQELEIDLLLSVEEYRNTKNQDLLNPDIV